jgi:hypothetical protein
MTFSDDELRSMVRAAMARHIGEESASRVAVDLPQAHPSHGLLPLAPGGAQGDGSCLIEPAVRCTHCGYCQSYGH